MIAARDGESIPEGWALDAEGRPTTDPRAGLAGTILPAAGAKGTKKKIRAQAQRAVVVAGEPT